MAKRVTEDNIARQERDAAEGRERRSQWVADAKAIAAEYIPPNGIEPAEEREKREALETMIAGRVPKAGFKSSQAKIANAQFKARERLESSLANLGLPMTREEREAIDRATLAKIELQDATREARHATTVLGVRVVLARRAEMAMGLDEDEAAAPPASAEAQG